MNNDVSRMHAVKIAFLAVFMCLLISIGNRELKAAEIDSRLHDEIAMILKDQKLMGAVCARMDPEAGIRIDAVEAVRASLGTTHGCRQSWR